MYQKLKTNEKFTLFHRAKHQITLFYHRVHRLARIFSILEWASLFGVALIFGMSFVTFYTFFVAFSDPRKFVIVFINLNGEADFEAILMLVSIFLGSIAFIRVLREARVRALWRHALLAEKIRRIE